MTQTAVSRSPAVAREQLPPRSAREQLTRAVRCGLTAGVVAVFVAAIGMVTTFETRTIVAPFLALGYLVLALVPLVAGWTAGKPAPAVEGYTAAPAGPREVAGGLATGLIAAVLLAGFAGTADSVDLRRVLIHVSPALVELLTFGRGLGTGTLLLLGGGGFLGGLGSGFHLVPLRWRGPLLTGFASVLVAGMLHQLFAQVLSGMGLRWLAGLLYARGGGLTPLGAVTVGAGAVVLDVIVASRRAVLQQRVAALSDRQRRTYGVVAAAAGLVVLAVLPQVLGTFLSEIFDLIGIFLLMALGLNIVIGYAGMLDLGYVAFFAVGAYTTAVLTAAGSPRWTPELTFLAALPFVVLAAALAGVVVGTPVLRMRGDYLAIVTLGFGEIARILFLSDWLSPTFGGAQGITRIPPLTLGPLRLSTPTELFYPIFAFVLLAVYVSWALKSSRIGRAWMAMREDETVAEAMGINIVTAKLSAFVVGASLASFGGALFASKIGSIFPHSFQILVSIVVLVIIIIGGMGSIPGVVVGAVALVGIPELLREFEEYRFLLYGALLIFMMLNRPEGLIPSRQRKLELHQEEVMQDAWFSAEERREAHQTPPRAPGRDPDAGLT